MTIREHEDLIESRAVALQQEAVTCPPHHWVIVDRIEDGFHEERWECRRCGDAKLVRTPTWAGGTRRMSNTSTWTAEDRILGGEDEAEAA